MENLYLTAIPIIGIAIRTTNQNNQAAVEIPQLWHDFHNQQIKDKIPNLVHDAIYVIYTQYESDHNAPYTTIIGCQVDSLAHVPLGMVAHLIPNGQYTKRIARGNLLENSVLHEWINIWNSPIFSERIPLILKYTDQRRKILLKQK